jgi:hypothetical protein
VPQALGYFKGMEKHAFTLSHCWLKLEDNEQETPGKGGAYVDRPRGHKASKTDLHHEASSIALGSTLKSVFAGKEEASAKRDEQRRRDKEEHMQCFTDI